MCAWSFRARFGESETAVRNLSYGDVLFVPKEVCKCPECGLLLVVDFYEWETETAIITRGGFHVDCFGEDEDDEDTWHRHWQSDWMDVIETTYKWLRENVRVGSVP